MNRSIIVTRYARSLVKYVRETGDGQRVCTEAEALVKALHAVPDLQRMVEASDDVVPPLRKKELLQAALGKEVSQEMDRFLALLLQRGRMPLVQDILRQFVTFYYREQGIRRARLTAVSPPTEQMLQRLRDLVRSITGDDVAFDVTVDPSLVGGFVLDLDDYLLDASVKRQLDLIREQFIERNRRIV